MPSFKDVDALNKHLANKSYITGYCLSQEDSTVLGTLSALPSKDAHPHAYRWAIHIVALTGAFIGAAATTSSAKAAPAAKKDDDLDLGFGDDDDEVNEDGENAEEAAATNARRARMEAARKLKEAADAKKNAGQEQKKKDKPVEKSLVVLEVKPWEADTDLKMVWEKICEYKQEGLSWGASFKLEPVAYGIMKLVMTCTIVDALVLMDDITENIEALDEFVQSVQVASMNKIS